MSTYSIDKSKFDDFVFGRRVIQWAVVLILGVTSVQSNLNYDLDDKTTFNIIWYCVFSVFAYLVLIGILLLTKKFNDVVKLLLSWDIKTIVRMDNERIEINHNSKYYAFDLEGLTVENFKYYGWYQNPLYGIGYAIVTTPTGQTILLSSILFDLGYGADKVEELFKSRVKRYSKKKINWFTPLPTTVD